MNNSSSFLKYIRFHKYLFVLVTFGIIIVFVDDNNLMTRAKHKAEIIELKSEIAKYRKQYEEDMAKMKELTENPENLEKIAREKYLMKRENEDVFIIEE